MKLETGKTCPVGGLGKEFWADGRNWPVYPASPWAPQDFDPDNTPEEWGRWRVEVKPGDARRHDFFLHLIQTADQTVELLNVIMPQSGLGLQK